MQQLFCYYQGAAIGNMYNEVTLLPRGETTLLHDKRLYA